MWDVCELRKVVETMVKREIIPQENIFILRFSYKKKTTLFNIIYNTSKMQSNIRLSK